MVGVLFGRWSVFYLVGGRWSVVGFPFGWWSVVNFWFGRWFLRSVRAMVGGRCLNQYMVGGRWFCTTPWSVPSPNMTFLLSIS